ncbi:hypothetical protein MTQ10_01080 [Streptomyces sp. XM83C]|jgi:hypothetical protein|uniref:Uncharacterized protein n=1 Tax=Streptomyces thermocoprophilus TaxID=78356 RepID=A0ABV5VAI0_9ACTN|nr:hypothetical protein [Streptomyces sp. XM83C]MCK1818229.1 hypothetical protein [Streptomyces sp. XM83C]
MPVTDQPQPHRPYALTGVSMRDLLASCAAADAVSLPPRTPDPGTGPHLTGAPRTDTARRPGTPHGRTGHPRAA